MWSASVSQLAVAWFKFWITGLCFTSSLPCIPDVQRRCWALLSYKDPTALQKQLDNDIKKWRNILVKTVRYWCWLVYFHRQANYIEQTDITGVILYNFQWEGNKAYFPKCPASALKPWAAPWLALKLIMSENITFWAIISWLSGSPSTYHPPSIHPFGVFRSWTTVRTCQGGPISRTVCSHHIQTANGITVTTVTNGVRSQTAQTMCEDSGAQRISNMHKSSRLYWT